MIEYYRQWKKFKRNHNIKARNFLISKYLYLAKYVSSKIPRYTDIYTYEDIIQWACIGLIDAIERFEPDRGIKFETYAISRIKGEIYDNIRKISPNYSKMKKKIENAYEKLFKLKGRNPTISEIAEEMGISVKQAKRLIQNYSPVFIISLDDLIKSKIFNKIQKADASTLLFEEKDVLSESIKKLSKREKEIITLYYYEGLTFKEIADILKVSEGRISQIHTMVILHLKQILKNYKNIWRENENIKGAVSKGN